MSLLTEAPIVTCAIPKCDRPVVGDKRLCDGCQQASRWGAIAGVVTLIVVSRLLDAAFTVWHGASH